jgi:hypothetical protein
MFTQEVGAVRVKAPCTQQPVAKLATPLLVPSMYHNVLYDTQYIPAWVESDK